MRVAEALIVQLPFPSQAAPHPLVHEYYRHYEARFRREFPRYFVPEHDLWELPLWVAHLSGMLGRAGAGHDFLDLSRRPATVEACAEAVLAASAGGDVVLMSPLAQNLDLAVAVSRLLQREGRRTLLGGNMAPLTAVADASHVHLGRLSTAQLRRILAGGTPVLTAEAARPGRSAHDLEEEPDYRLLAGFRGRVPLLRLNASHGCLHACRFCGDAWTAQLVDVAPDALEREVAQLEALFPETRLVYVGDKTFGQSRVAVERLLRVFAERPGYQFVVQTHVLQVNDRLIERMARLGVRVVEMGFETADSRVLREEQKATRGTGHYLERIRALRAAGMRVVLNVLGGLPSERPGSHELTLRFLEDTAGEVWLYNLYNFVPYPLTPYFASIRGRIFNWRYADWREDAPPVFEPYHQSVDDSWRQFLETVALATRLVREERPAALTGGRP